MDPRMIKFLLKHHVLTLATVNDNEPYCCSLYYAFMDTHEMLVFMSNDETKHMTDVKHNNHVAGAIALESSVAKVQGIQFQGMVEVLDGKLLVEAKNAYQKKFPMAKLMSGTVYGIALHKMKMTDNTLGFGKKLHWKKEDEEMAENLQL
ncbi:MAG: pyridoxamine 5'-phosphate oxidase family protein [Bacteroidota bacterium]